MCGIFGAVALQAGATLRHPECLTAMAQSLRHRGPDGERIVGHERARLGARRLAIMDLTTGDQPFQSPDGALWMICNGEMYNAAELRREGQRSGYPFRSTGDIETIVPLYQGLGPDSVARLEGMFGLAVWDDRRERLLLARDRAGEKPLFWTEVAGELRFASEIQALLTYPDQPRRVNPAAAALYGALGYVPSPHTMIDGISKLPPAHLLVADRKGLAVRRYWDPAAVAARRPGHAAQRAAPCGRARADVGRARGGIYERWARFVAARRRRGAGHGGRADPHLLRAVHRAGLRREPSRGSCDASHPHDPPRGHRGRPRARARLRSHNQLARRAGRRPRHPAHLLTRRGGTGARQSGALG